ncbi:MAG: pyruvate kinase [Candidatus Parcubacteria bacterium]|jgi:pyruvate kinase
MKSSQLKRTKIVSTLSPRVATEESLTEFIRQGANVFRLNFSHGSYDEYSQMISTIKKVRQDLDLPVAILQDLQGPRVRVEALETPLDIIVGDIVYITNSQYEYNFADGVKILPIDHDLSPILKAGETVLIEDGLIELLVKEAIPENHYTIAEAKTNSQIKGRKGVNFPGSAVDFPVITDKDKSDLKFGLSQGVDFVAMSFVRSAEDIKELRRLIDLEPNKSSNPLIIAKIEKPDAVSQIESIMDVVDGVMVARGDLGIEVQAEKVPIIQKHIIELALLKGKRVIVATQMLDSMIRNPRPTRAEVSDVANAVIDHTDAVMLSGETSGGAYPLEAVSMMQKIILSTEDSAYDNFFDEYISDEDMKNIYKELAYGAQHLARASEVDGIIVIDREGKGIAEYMSQFRAEIPVFVITENKEYFYHTALTWGVTSIFNQDPKDIYKTISNVQKTYFEDGIDGHYFVVVDITEQNRESIQMFLV